MNIFVPNKIRYALWHLSNLAIGWLFGYLAVLILLGNQTNLTVLLGLVAVSFAVALILLPVTVTRQVKLMAITIFDEAIAGPSIWANTAIRFSLKTLDTKKSQRRNMFQRLLGYRLIVSTSGEKILFVDRVFDKDQVTEILKITGCADSVAV